MRTAPFHLTTVLQIRRPRLFSCAQRGRLALVML
jgi:hypothetical protein